MIGRIGNPHIGVRTINGRSTRGVLRVGPLQFPCALGRSGLSVLKREGDGATPRGRFSVRRAFYRADRIARPRTGVELRGLRRADGWCDALGDRNYNRIVRLPYSASSERLWREDGLYDLILVLSHNDIPRVQGRGSAIFMHVARAGLLPTEGCVALKREHLVRVLQHLNRRTSVEIGLLNGR